MRFFIGVIVILFVLGCGSGDGGGNSNEVNISQESEPDRSENESNASAVGNVAPVVYDVALTMQEDTSAYIALNGSDADGDDIVYALSSLPQHGSYDLASGVYTPQADFYGTDSFTYLANDGKSDSATATVTITVTPQEDNPYAYDISVATQADNSVRIRFQGDDPDGDALTYTYTTPSNGALSPSASNEVVYTPNSGFYGNDTFTYTAVDTKNNVSNTATVSISVARPATTSVTIRGRITYDRVPGIGSSTSTAYSLDYTSTVQKPVRNAIVTLLDANDAVLQETTSDENGTYAFFGVAQNTLVRVRVAAKMYRADTATPSWDVQVVDNTNAQALYTMQGDLVDSGISDQIRDLHAPSGWGGSGYTSPRTAAPFAILDSIYEAMQTVLSADPQAVFPPLLVNWSPNNVALSGDVTRGEITTSHYSNANLYILGDADSDTDEYDDHVITHEWGHYYEDMFSRSDSIGGSHSGGDLLDIRVAFGEGWGNAFSAIALRDPIYFDTYGNLQANGWSMDIESATDRDPGWFSEGSVQRIIYDLWDATNESAASDTVTLGFAPIHTVMTASQKNTTAFTSLFSFIYALKLQNPSEASGIDAIVANENIATITDIFGSGRTNRSTDYPYGDVSLNAETSVTLSNRDGSYNKLSNRRYVRFTLATGGTYTIDVRQISAVGSSDPDIYVYKSDPFELVAVGNQSGGSESVTLSNVQAGTYFIDIVDYNNVPSAVFSVRLR